ncbi:MAG: Ig-like domain-containing protein [Deltaproteobacteria bacterium]
MPSVLDASGDDRGRGEAGSSGFLLPSSELPPDAGADSDRGDSDPLVTAPDPSAPSIVNVTPANGATGVAADAAITLTFSKPMNTAAVEAAYSSSSLPAGAVSFSWSAGDTVLEITPNQLLTRATGTDPASTVASRYSFEISDAARDLEGNVLPRLSTSFTTLREIQATLSALSNRTLTGNWRSDNVFGTNDCAQNTNVACVGDSSNGNSTYRGFVTFDLSSLPAAIQDVSAAELRMSIDNILAAPFTTLGTLGVEHVSFDVIDLTAFSAAALGSFIGITDSAAGGDVLRADVLEAARQDVAERERSQYRLRFTVNSDNDGNADMVELNCSSERLVLTYLLP